MSSVGESDTSNTEKEGLMPIGVAAIVLGSVAALVLIIAVTCFCCSWWRKNPVKKRTLIIKKKPKVHYATRAKRDVLLPDPITHDAKPGSTNGSELSVYTLPCYLRRKHIGPYLTTDRRSMTLANGNIDHTSRVRRQKALTMAPSTMSNGLLMLTQGGGGPVACIQKGNSMKVSTTQDENLGALVPVRSSMYSSLPRPTSSLLGSQINSGIIDIATQQAHPNGTYWMTPGSSLIGDGTQPHSATLQVIAEESSLGHQQTILLDPYTGEPKTIRDIDSIYRL